MRTASDEGPAYGAALLAGVTIGAYGSVDEATSIIRMREEVTEFDPARVAAYEQAYEAYRSLYPATKETMHSLTELAKKH